MPITGGFHKAVERLIAVGGEALQIFCRNQRQWKSPPITSDEATAFRKSWQSAGEIPVAVHGSYLINLASPEVAVARKSIEAFKEELERTALLGISCFIFHPGAHRGAGIKEGIRSVVKNLDEALRKASLRPLWILLETSSGQGTSLGKNFDELSEIIERSRFSHCLGICIDTAHVFASGYDLRTPDGYNNMLEEIDKKIGIEKIRFFHLNDSSSDVGSYIDRHTHIGKGRLGLEVFRTIVNDERFSNIPMVIETPKEEGLKKDRENISILKSLVKK